MKFTKIQKLRRFVIITRWKTWIFPLLCFLPYLASIFWLISRGQIWIVQVMLAPLLMILIVVSLGLFLAHFEFRR
jgi:hypothetical protein